MIRPIQIADFTYDLPDDRIAKFPAEHRDSSKLLVYNNREITQTVFSEIHKLLDASTLVVFNNTKVVRARLIFHKSTGARIEIFCLEPALPAEYEMAFAAKRECRWHCMIGNAKKLSGEVELLFGDHRLTAERESGDLVRFCWNSDHTFGQLLEILGRTPIPPYLRRPSTEIDEERYQTTYAKFEGSVAAPTAGLHFTYEVLSNIKNSAEVTLHVGAGTFLPVKELDATKHEMHVEFFDVTIDDLQKLADNQGNIIAVGTTTVRTLESLAVLGRRVIDQGHPKSDQPVGQWEPYQNNSQGGELQALLSFMKSNNMKKLFGSTKIMIAPGYNFRTIRGLVTNFHQPQSTLLLLISAVVGDKWREIYQYAMDNNFRFLSYGDSSLLMCTKSDE